MEVATGQDREYLDRPWDMAVKRDRIYLDAKNDLTRIPDFIDSRIRLAGGHTLANWFRRADVLEGPPYREVVADVCKAQKVKVANDDDAAAMEFKLISTLFERRWAKMTEAERAEFIKFFKARTGFGGALAAGMSFAALAVAL
ncbi:MAG TPA: hypothetical protein VNC39_14215 [Acidocella sp.]|jgi:uncharacterized protein YaaW (UPF0174 family)|uniref:hypothetical protein n=1 Tax=Acidocella sp. TaxID=50710 RepID=UPI002BCFE03F|nr:hypothetical protein [Acidocella sp.]HVE23121.1 hypothetical protein [Acidocella sp.]